VEIRVVGHRRPQPLLILSATAFAVLSLVAPANAAGADHKPTAKSIQERGVRATTPSSNRVLASAEPGEDEDEAGVIAARAQFHQSITAAPAEVAPAAGLAAATDAANGLASQQEVRWHEVTDKPFLNDPAGTGANFGVGWGYVTGR
jgi:hypothetical protein